MAPPHRPGHDPRMGGILVTGFEPFGRWRVNSSWEGVRVLAATRRGLAVRRLPVCHEAAAEAIREAIQGLQPDAVLLTGLASGGSLRLETLARPGPLVPWSGATRPGRWDFPRSFNRLYALGVPAKLSADAGGYVCDTTYWAALGEAVPQVAFLHVPPLGGSWTPVRIARAIDACLS